MVDIIHDMQENIWYNWDGFLNIVLRWKSLHGVLSMWMSMLVRLKTILFYFEKLLLSFSKGFHGYLYFCFFDTWREQRERQSVASIVRFADSRHKITKDDHTIKFFFVLSASDGQKGYSLKLKQNVRENNGENSAKPN